MSPATRMLLLCALLASATACGDDVVCGPEEGAPSQLSSSDLGGNEILWENFRSSPNNDCSEAGAPVSLTLEANQVGDAQRKLIFCLPRPDKLYGETIPVDDSNRLQVIDVFANTGPSPDCLASLDRSRASSGTLRFQGVCDDGVDPAGYSLEFAMTLPLTISCGDQISEDALSLQGPVRVEAN